MSDPCHSWPDAKVGLSGAQRDQFRAEARAKFEPRRDLQAERAAIFGAPPAPRQTDAERLEEQVERAAQAWVDVRRKVAGWPADLAAAEIRKTTQMFGSEPGSKPAFEQILARIPQRQTKEVDPATLDPATRKLLAAMGIRETKKED